jgi:hypothetical protein
MILGVRFFKVLTIASCALTIPVGLQAQINTCGCSLADFGINASIMTIYSLTVQVQ